MSIASAAPLDGKIIPHLVLPAAVADSPTKLAEINRELARRQLSPLRIDSKWAVMSTTDGPGQVAAALQVLAELRVTALALDLPAGVAGVAAPADAEGGPVANDGAGESIPD
jgi:hypothetical protein